MEQRDNVEVIARILESYDIEEINNLFEDQIRGEGGSSYTGVKVDHLTPLYHSYQSIIEMENIDLEDEDIVSETKERFINICKIIIHLLSKKFDISITDEYLDNNRGLLPEITIALYTFFVINLQSSIYDLVLEYLEVEKASIIEAYKDCIDAKDTVATFNRKIFNADDALICSNMTDIVDYILSTIDDAMVKSYINLEDDISFAVINRIMDSGVMVSSFVRVFGDIFKENLSLRSQISYSLIVEYTKRYGSV